MTVPSLIDDLRAIDERARADAHKDLPVPGSAGRIVVRYRAARELRDKLSDVIAAYRAGSALTAAQEQQMLIDCHEQIMRRPVLDGPPESYDGDEPLRFDAGDDRWPDNPETARECVARLFHLDEHPLAAAGHVETIIDWLQGLDTDIRTLIAGESGGGATTSSPPPAST
jgi:hypothetical protein